jgi:thiol:disulfide interchange protein
MGPGTFFYRLGQIGPLALAGYLVTRFVPKNWFSLMRLFGQTSLLVYWVHVELVYGLLLKRLHHRLDITWATVGLVLMTAAMAGVAKLRLRYWHGWPRRKIRVPKPAGNLPAPLGPL